MPEKLGKNFLIDQNIVQKIIRSADLGAEDLVLEVGPGKGVLTEALVQKAKKVVAVEIDPDLSAALQEKFKTHRNIKVLNKDILKVNISELFPHPTFGHPLPKGGEDINKSYKVVANIPYYITSKIIRFFLENKNPPEEMFLMVQKEVAERIVDGPGKMSLLSLSVQYYAKAKILFPVSRNCFSPIPEVDSAVIRLITKNEKFDLEDTQKIFRLARIGFASKRKTLLNNLSNGLRLEKQAALKNLEQSGFDQNTRAQELSVEDWKKLARLF